MAPCFEPRCFSVHASGDATGALGTEYRPLAVKVVQEEKGVWGHVTPGRPDARRPECFGKSGGAGVLVVGL